jgi:hypothetical protein
MRDSLGPLHRNPPVQRAGEEVVPEAVERRLLPYRPSGSADGRRMALVKGLSIYRHLLGSEMGWEREQYLREHFLQGRAQS